MRKFFPLFLIVSILFSLPAAAQALLSGIKGQVVTSDGQPAPDVSIQLKNKNKGTLTDARGAFVLRKLQPGTYILQASLVGHEPREQEVTVTEDQITKVSIQLAASVQQLEEVNIRSGRNRYKADQVSGSLRLQTPLINVPQNIQVVQAQQLADQQVYDIVDGITRNVSGATRQGHWDNQYANIRMRGSKIPAFRNGMNIEASWGPTAEDASMIERIEFVKGPAGFMLANGEPGGFYNVVTKKPTGQTRGSATMSMGSFSTYRAALDFDGKLSKDGKLLYRLNTAGQLKDFYTKYNYSNRFMVAPVVKYLVDDRTSVMLEYTFQGSSYLANGNYQFSKKGLLDDSVRNDFFYGDPSLTPGQLRDHSVYAYLDHKINDNWQLHAQVAYFDFSMVANSTWFSRVWANGDAERYVSIGDEAGQNRFGQASFSGKEKTGSISHTILGGLDMGNKKFWGDFRTLKNNVRLPGNKLFNVYNPVYGIPFDSLPKIDRSVDVKTRAGSTVYATVTSYGSVYLQDELGFFADKLRLSLAGRFTHSETVGKTAAAGIADEVFTPRIGLSFSINKGTSVYVLRDESFVPQSGTDYFGNAFVPVRGKDLEAGIKKEWMKGKWMSSLTVYRILRENTLTNDPDPTHVLGNGSMAQVQLGETRTEGVEVDVTGEVVPGLNVTLNYAYTDSRITKEVLNPLPTATPVKTVGNVTPNTARHVTNGWLQYRIPKGLLEGFGPSAGFQWLADRHVGTTTTPNIPNYFRTDAGLNYSKGRVHLSLLVNNLLDNRKLLTAASLDTKPATDPTGFYSYIVEARRNFRMSVGYRF
ncbi:TonB-dependent receptor [Paraflavisolibacter sp. H34]|uniref:TonB-dependent receptor n=1 Tax=Huijunlia imazamoxiresistens TaxID=3127457 RepID=UPI003017DB81